jgi:hypothetical protein
LLEPNSQGYVKFQADVTKKNPGSHRFKVTVEYEGGSVKIVTAWVRVAYEPDVRIIPGALFLDVVEGKNASTSFALVDYRRVPLRIVGTNVTSGGCHIRVTEEPAEYSPGWRYSFEISYSDPPSEERAELGETVVLQTSDSDHELVRIPLTIHRRQRIHVVPSIVKLKPGRITRIAVRDVSGERIAIDACESGGLVSASFREEPEPVKFITLSLPNTPIQSSRYPTTVRIKLRQPCSKVLPVSVALDQSGP